jgi:hypothetical protein
LRQSFSDLEIILPFGFLFCSAGGNLAGRKEWQAAHKIDDSK